MAVEIANAYVSLVVTSKGIGAQLEKELGVPVADAAKKAGDTATKSLAQTGQQFTKLGIGALAVAGAVGAGLLKTGKSASDLGESVNAVKVTFGSAAAGILKLGENAAHSMGLSNTAFNGLAVQFSAFSTTIAGKGGDVVGTLQSITQRAADFASVMNIDVADAAIIFQSALAGETEPIRKFGIDLSAATVTAFAYAHGIGTIGTELTEGEKVQARYALLMEATAKNQGDFANTSDSAANAMRIAKAEAENAAASIGQVVAPAMAFAATKAADLVKGFVSLNDASGGLLVKGVAVVGGLAAVAGVVSTVAGQVIKFKGFLTDASGSLNNFGKAAGIAAKTVGALGIGIVALEALNKLTSDAKGTTEAMNKFIATTGKIDQSDDPLGHWLEAMADLSKATIAGKGAMKTFFDVAKHGTSDTQAGLQGMVESFDKLLVISPDLAKKTASAFEEADRQARAGNEDARKFLDAYGLSTEQIAKFRVKVDDASGAQQVLAGATTNSTAATVIDTKAQDELDKALKTTADELQKSADTLNSQVSAMRAAADATYAEADATDALAKFNAGLSDKLKAAKGDQAEVNAIFREGTTLAATHADAVVRIGVEHAKATGVTLTATQQQDAWNREMLFSAMNAVPAERDAILGYIADANAIPAEKTTEISALIAQGRFEEAAALLAGLSAARTATVEADAETAEAKKDLDKVAAGPYVATVRLVVPKNWQGPVNPGTVLVNPTDYPQNAAGTSSWRGGMTWLAEEGPELVDLPRGSVVHNAADTHQMLAGMGNLEPRTGTTPFIGGDFINNRRDFTIGDMNQVFAMARLRQ